VEAPGVATTWEQFEESLRDARFWPKLLKRRTFATAAEFSGVLRCDPESTEFLETLWRRWEPSPGAKRRVGLPAPPKFWPRGACPIDRVSRNRSRFWGVTTPT
jgi:hypothetical protein